MFMDDDYWFNQRIADAEFAAEQQRTCRHLGAVESWDSNPPRRICCQCGADISEQTAT